MGYRRKNKTKKLNEMGEKGPSEAAAARGSQGSSNTNSPGVTTDGNNSGNKNAGNKKKSGWGNNKHGQAASGAGKGKDGSDLMGYKKVITYENEAFTNYYRNQKICDSEEEFQQFVKAIQSPLPIGCRVNGVGGDQGNRIWEQFKSLLDVGEDKKEEDKEDKQQNESAEASDKKDDDKKDDDKKDDTKPEPVDLTLLRPKFLKFFPRQLALQFDSLNSKVVKRDEKFQFLKKFLFSNEVHGGIQRQETVSMIPPLFMDVQADDLCLDMCAAPGSKTCQIIEKLHWEANVERGCGEESLFLVIILLITFYSTD
jgi:hypothetical protein